jgi:membrane associated rhomboid family serine protease
MPWMSVTVALIAVTCAVTWLAWQTPSLQSRLILWPPAIARRGQWYRLVSYGFLHANGMHLLFNMFTFYFFGTQIERAFASHLGPFGFVGFYLSALVVSILPSYSQHREDPDYYSLGASGAVSAVLFASILIAPWNWLYVFFVPMPAIVFAVLYVGYSIWMDRRGKDQVNHSAHLWGAAYGIAFFIVLEPRLLRHFFEQLARPDVAP